MYKKMINAYFISLFLCSGLIASQQLATQQEYELMSSPSARLRKFMKKNSPETTEEEFNTVLQNRLSKHTAQMEELRQNIKDGLFSAEGEEPELMSETDQNFILVQELLQKYGYNNLLKKNLAELDRDKIGLVLYDMTKAQFPQCVRFFHEETTHAIGNKYCHVTLIIALGMELKKPTTPEETIQACLDNCFDKIHQFMHSSEKITEKVFDPKFGIRKIFDPFSKYKQSEKNLTRKKKIKKRYWIQELH